LKKKTQNISAKDRFAVIDDRATMKAIVTTGNGGYEKLEYRDVPIVHLDMRDLYLKDLTLIGCTAWDEPIFPNLISYIEKGEIKPLLAKKFPLQSIVEAQKEFSEKKHVGKFVLIPPPLDDEKQ
jgi:threonine dehydrogenase-like Zn-dependent dehydrogenase